MVKKITSLLGFALFVLFCYVTFMLSWPYYKAWEYESDARDIIRFDVRDPYKVQEKLYQAGVDMGIPVQESSVLITQNFEGEYIAKVRWTQIVDIFGYYQKSYEFQFEVGGKELANKK